MGLFSCFSRNVETAGAPRTASLSSAAVHPHQTGSHHENSCKGKQNAALMKVLSALASLSADDLGWWTSLRLAAEALTCEFDACQASIYLLGSNAEAHLVASAGLDDELSSGGWLRSTAGYDVADALQQAQEDDMSTRPVAYREVAMAAKDHSDLPEEWQLLARRHGCQQFAAVGIVAAGTPLGILSLAAKGPFLPASWTAEALTTIGAMLMVHVKRAQVLADVLPSLYASTTISQVVQALGAAAAEAAAAVVHVRGQARVAFIQPGTDAAAVFPHELTQADDRTGSLVGSPLPLSQRVRRASCEFIMTQDRSMAHMRGGSGSGSSRHKISTDGWKHPGTGGMPSGGGSQPGAIPRRASFLAGSKTSTCNTCKGHTLPLTSTLLAEALSKGAAGLCVDDCAVHVQDTKSFPRDLVLTRNATMPLSLALATSMAAEGSSDNVNSGSRGLSKSHCSSSYVSSKGSDSDKKPVLALYTIFGQPLPQPLLQAVVRSLRELLLAVGPLVATKTSGDLRSEWECLQAELKGALQRKGFDTATSTAEDVMIEDEGPVSTVMLVTSSDGRAVAEVDSYTAAGGHHVPASAAAADCAEDLKRNGSATDESASPFTAVATKTQPPRVRGPGSVVYMRTPPGDGLRGPKISTARHCLGMGSSSLHRGVGPDGSLRSNPSQVSDTGADGSVQGLMQSSVTTGGSERPAEWGLNNRALVKAMMRDHCVSFRLEAAQSPRGASKLAPIISIMHERLKAAQAVQITSGRSEARKADLHSLQLLQEVGEGGYGTVYRATYHGAEVAVKVIQETKLSVPKGKNGSSDRQSAAASVALHKQNLHDAIELVASVSMSHPNIVQVLTFFTDCKIQDIDNVLESMETDLDASGASTAPRLVHLPSLLESPAPGQDLPGASSMALVMEYCDAGSLCEAIEDRVFFRQLKPTDPADRRRGKPMLAICLRSVFSTLLEVALALRHMHSLHLVHCDLKPQNVLLKSSPRDPRGFTAKLSDFGLSKMMAHNEDGQLVIDEAVASGTITHVAPEVFLGKKPVGAAVDIYAFGVIMYQMLCGSKLYEGLTAQQVANAVARQGLRPHMPSWVPANYRTLAERCWHALPSARPTADELVRQLEKLGAAGGPQSGPTQRPQSGYQSYQNQLGARDI